MFAYGSRSWRDLGRANPDPGLGIKMTLGILRALGPVEDTYRIRVLRRKRGRIEVEVSCRCLKTEDLALKPYPVRQNASPHSSPAHRLRLPLCFFPVSLQLPSTSTAYIHQAQKVKSILPSCRANITFHVKIVRGLSAFPSRSTCIHVVSRRLRACSMPTCSFRFSASHENEGLSLPGHCPFFWLVNLHAVGS